MVLLVRKGGCCTTSTASAYDKKDSSEGERKHPAAISDQPSSNSSDSLFCSSAGNSGRSQEMSFAADGTPTKKMLTASNASSASSFASLDYQTQNMRLVTGAEVEHGTGTILDEDDDEGGGQEGEEEGLISCSMSRTGEDTEDNADEWEEEVEKCEPFLNPTAESPMR